LTQRNGVIDGQRSREAHATVKAAHLTRSLQRAATRDRSSR
jgi:hypothetical protein